MELIAELFDNLTRALGLLIFAASAMFVAWAAFQYMTAQGDPQAQAKARNQVIGVGLAMVVGGFAGFFPSLFNDLILRPVGLDVVFYATSCDGRLRDVLIPRSGTFTLNTIRVNNEVFAIQQRYPDDCSREYWDPKATNVKVDLAALTRGTNFVVEIAAGVAAGDHAFGSPPNAKNACFTWGPADPAGKYRSHALSNSDLYVGPAKLAKAFYISLPGVGALPKGRVRRDNLGNVMIFWGEEDGSYDATQPSRLPLDGSDCWYYSAGKVNKWYSSQDTYY